MLSTSENLESLM